MNWGLFLLLSVTPLATGAIIGWLLGILSDRRIQKRVDRPSELARQPQDD